MALKKLKAVLKRKMGMQYWVVECPYCKKNHWLQAGTYGSDPEKTLKARLLPCHRMMEIVKA